MTQQPESTWDSAEFENYKLWLDRIREERGTHGVAEATFKLYIENRRLRAENRQLQSAPSKPVIKPASSVPRPASPGRTAQLEQGRKTREAIHVFLQDYTSEHGQSPSFREIAAAVGVTNAVITRHLNRLERDGKIIREPGVERGIRLV